MTPDLTRAVATHRELVERLKAMFPEESEESLGDTIAGETTLDGAILATVRAAVEREAMADAISDMMDTLATRAMRLKGGAARLRSAALQAMQEAGMSRINGPDMTLSVNPGKGHVVIVEESLIPDRYVRTERRILKKELRDDLLFNEVPGAELSNPQPYLTVRRT